MKQRVSPYIFPGLISQTSREFYIIEIICSMENIKFEDLKKKNVRGKHGDLKKLISALIYRYTDLRLFRLGMLMNLTESGIYGTLESFKDLLETDIDFLNKFQFYDRYFSERLKIKKNARNIFRDKRFNQIFK